MVAGIATLRRMRRAHLVLAAVTSVWGTIPLIVREVDLPAPAVVFARVGLASLGLGVALLLGRGAGPRLLSYRPGRCVLISGILAVHWCALFAAYGRAPIGTVLFIVYLAPVGIAALAPVVLGERLTRRVLVSLAVALAGFALLAGPAVESAGRDGLALAGFAALSFAALVVGSKPLAQHYGGVRLAFLEMAGAAVFLLPVAATTTWGEPRLDWAWLLVLGLVHTGIGVALYLGALSMVGATTTGIMGYVEPASAVAWAWLLLGERPRLATMIGGVLIFAAGALAVRTPVPLEVPVDVPG